MINLRTNTLQITKANLYPQNSSKILQGLVINTQGNDNIVKFAFRIKDGVRTGYAFLGAGGFGLEGDRNPYIIYDNKISKKYLKMKFFEVSSQEMLNEVQNINLSGERRKDKEAGVTKNSIYYLEKIISKYGAVSFDLSPSYDFIESKLPDYARLKIYQINLDYERTFVLARQNINFLSIGVIFYFDIEQYIEDEQILNSSFYDYVLNDDIVIFDILRDNKRIPNSILPIQDLRIMKSSFQQTNYLDNLLHILSSDISFNRLANTEQFLQNNTSFIDSEKLNEIINSINPTVEPRKQKFFSNAYFSRTKLDSNSFTFSLKYKDLISINSVYKKFLDYSTLKAVFLDECGICSLKIVRREMKKNNENFFSPLEDTTKVIVASNDIKGGGLKAFNSDSASIEEISNFTGESQFDIGQSSLSQARIAKNRNFSVTDLKAFQDKRGYYQYGLEISITNSINEFLKNKALQMNEDITGLKDYLEEIKRADGYKTSFNEQFEQKFNLPRGSKVSFNQMIINTVSNFMVNAALFGIEDVNGLEQDLINTLYPTKTNANVIQYFINIYEKFLDQVYNIINNNINNTFTVQHWFKEIIDTTIPINIGYKFFDTSAYRGLAVLNTEEFYKRVNKEINTFSSQINVDFNDYGNKQFSFLTPTSITTKSKTLTFNKLEEDPNNLTLKDYTDTFIDIKDSLIYDYKAVNDASIKTKNLLANISVSMPNLFLPLQVSSKIDGPVTKNPNVDETSLVIALLNSYDSSIGKFITKQEPINNLTLKEIQTRKPIDAEERKTLPIHLNLLIDDKSALLKADEKYKKSLTLNAKFNLLFNTIHSIEVLEYTNEYFNENWNLLDKQKIDSMLDGYFYLCRFKSYKNNSRGIEGIRDIKLPIYDEYFFLTKSNVEFVYRASARLIAEEAARIAAEEAARRAAEEEAARRRREEEAAEDAAKVANRTVSQATLDKINNIVNRVDTQGVFLDNLSKNLKENVALPSPLPTSPVISTASTTKLSPTVSPTATPKLSQPFSQTGTGKIGSFRKF